MRRTRHHGYSLIELLLVMGTLAVITAITIPMMRTAMLRAQVSAVATDAKALHRAFKRFHIDQSMYPNSETGPAFNVHTFEPLVSMGYYDGRVTPKLFAERADGYDAPDDAGLNQEFWLELTLKADPTIRFLVADSDDAPLSGGVYYDGIYMFRNGVLTPLTEPVK